MTDPSFSVEIHSAVTAASRRYLAGRRERVEAFTRKHFSIPGALRLNRRALGKDLLRAPASVLWAAPYLLARGALALGRKVGLRRAADCLERLPPGFKTDVERELEWLIYSELLELPFEQDGRRCTRDALLEAILDEPVIGRRLSEELLKLDELARQPLFHGKLEEFLRTYTASRTAAADLAGALLNLAAGAAAFHKFTPGALLAGSAAAGALANYLAVSQFILGPTLGALYYGLFPATASTGLLLGTVGGLMAALGVLSAGAGVLTDPIQQALGLHRRKLLKLLDALERELLAQGGGYRLHDAYVARVFDLLDLLKTVTRSLHS